MTPKHTVIVDQIGRTILGEQVGETDTTLTLYNPIILHFQPSQNGQLELQVFPLFFFELLDKEQRNVNSWTFSKTSIAISDVVLNEDILTRYAAINTPSKPVEKNPKVISIDDI